MARKALARAAAGKPWNGHTLEVRAVYSRGGASGIRYEVAAASLPPHIAARIATPAFAAAVPVPAPRAPLGGDWRLQLALRVIAAGPPGSEARAAALREVAAGSVRPNGERGGEPVAERSLRRWVATCEARGVLALVTPRARRADRGASRVIAWRAWDRAMDAAGVQEARQREIAAELHAKVMGCWKAGATSAARIALLMGPECHRLAYEAGVRLPDADMASLCRMPPHFPNRKDRRRARVAHTKARDAAAFSANHVPRVFRDRSRLRPMDAVAADVRHGDNLYSRADGTPATAKLVCFLDLATNRLFAQPFLLPKREAIRREHVLFALRAMMEHPAWGVPRALYMDNGSEFEMGCAPDDLAHLADLLRRVGGEMRVERVGTVRSKPYQPESKVVETTFSALTRSIEPMYRGFIGSERMKKKTENKGRAPVPMPGDEAAVRATYAEMIAFYNAAPQQRGHIKGRSPNGAFGAFVRVDAANPWQAITFRPGEFDLAFGKDERRVVQRGGELHIKNRVLRHPDLTAMVGEPVTVRVPFGGDLARVVVMGDDGNPMLVAERVDATEFWDRGGARQHQQNLRDANRAATAAAAGAAKVDLPAMARAVAAALPPPVPLPPLAEASVHPVIREAADAACGAVEPLRPRAEAKRRDDFERQSRARNAVLEARRRAV